MQKLSPMVGKLFAYLFALPMSAFFPNTEVLTVPPVFIFGDSTVDNGNNNFLPQSTAKANFLPYGIDFPDARPTGRFSNGYNTADFLAKMYGLRKSPPPFLSFVKGKKFNKKFCRGVNFASGGSGVFKATGSKKYGQVLPLDVQIENFMKVHADLEKHKCSTKMELFLSKTIFIISTGSNDLFENFISYGSQSSVRKEQFINTLTSLYKEQLKRLYNLGARRFGIINVGKIGCCPSQRILNSTGGCLEDLNENARSFNLAMNAILQDLSLELEGMKYSLGNSLELGNMVSSNPLAYGFKESERACCGAGKLNGEKPCTPNSSYCSDRKGYYFWDLYHPTEAASRLAAQMLYHGDQAFVSPINFKELAKNDD